MATQDNDGVISFGTTTAVISTRPSAIVAYSAASGGTKKFDKDLTSIAVTDADGNAVIGSTIPDNTTVSIAAGALDLALTGGDLLESGREDVLEAAIALGWYWGLENSSDTELTGSNGLSRVQLDESHFS